MRQKVAATAAAAAEATEQHQGGSRAAERLRSSNSAAAYALQHQRELLGSNSPTSAWSPTGSPPVMDVPIETVAIQQLYLTSSDSTAVYAQQEQQAAATETAAGNSGQPQNCTNRFQQQRLGGRNSRNSAELQPSRKVAGGDVQQPQASGPKPPQCGEQRQRCSDRQQRNSRQQAAELHQLRSCGAKAVRSDSTAAEAREKCYAGQG